jgi:hypothetical protein
MAAAIISVLSKKYGFDADEALAYFNDHKHETGSATSISTVQRAENAISKTQAEIDGLKAKIPAKKGKLLEKANEKLGKLEEKLAEQLKKLEEKKAREAEKAAPKTPKKAGKAKEKTDAPPAPKKEKKEDDRRIKRVSPTMVKLLTKVFEDAKSEFKKENGAAFAKYINELTKDDYEAKNLGDLMRDFVAALAPPPSEPVKDFDAKEPEEIEGEDNTEVVFEGVKYVVGDVSRRVYEADEVNGDRFVGILGLGKFKNMKV